MYIHTHVQEKVKQREREKKEGAEKKYLQSMKV